MSLPDSSPATASASLPGPHDTPSRTDDAAIPVPLKDLVWHEICEPSRLERLKESLRCETLRDSIHVAAGDLPIILDGAHRSRAAQALGHITIPAHMVPIPASQHVPGWTHVYQDHPAPAGLLLLNGGTGPIIATIHHNGLQHDIRAASYTTADLHRAYWHVAHTMADARYQRTPQPPTNGTAVMWLLPTWSTVAQIAVDHGPFPAGITRLGDAFRQLCSGCSAPQHTTH